jgi:hypothetical protein
VIFFLDKVFKKFQSLEELSSFVKNNDENDFLEYKSSSILFSKKDNQDQNKKKRQLLETVSAFANTKGGLIIIGFDEERDELDEGVDLAEWNEKRLYDVIYGNLEPPLEGLKIDIIKKNKEYGYFILYVPEGITAYQNKLDKRYYGRFGEKDIPLDDYWIRLLMNKTSKPVFQVYLLPASVWLGEGDISNLIYSLGFRIMIKNVSTIPSREYTIEVKAEESLGLVYIDSKITEWSLIEIPKFRYYIKLQKILITSNYHLDNQIILLPNQLIEITRFDRDLKIAFYEEEPNGLLEVIVYSENPQPQHFYYQFTSELCKELLNELRKTRLGVLYKRIITMNQLKKN